MSKNTSIKVIILAYSMFGVIGLTSSMFSPSPILYAIGSGLTLFSYSTISVLSIRLSFKELFITLIPLNVINIISSYASTAFFFIKYQALFTKLDEYAVVVMNASRNNVTVSSEYLKETMGSDIFRLNISSGITEKVNFLADYTNSVPDWVAVVPLILLLFYVAGDLILGFITNIFTALTYPVIMVITAVGVVSFSLNWKYVYFVPQLWTPISSTVDSFLRIYILRAVFFRFMKNHPLIKTYMKSDQNVS